MAEENDITANKLAEKNQVTTKEPQQVTTKNPKKVEAGKRLAESNRRRREAKQREEQAKLEKSGVNQYYGIRAVIALGVIGGLGYYIYQSKKVEQPWGCCTTPGPQGPSNPQQNKPHPQAIATQPQTNKFEMD